MQAQLQDAQRQAQEAGQQLAAARAEAAAASQQLTLLRAEAGSLRTQAASASGDKQVMCWSLGGTYATVSSFICVFVVRLSAQRTPLDCL